jgi:hypothetical protein
MNKLRHGMSIARLCLLASILTIIIDSAGSIRYVQCNADADGNDSKAHKLPSYNAVLLMTRRQKAE